MDQLEVLEDFFLLVPKLFVKKLLLNLLHQKLDILNFLIYKLPKLVLYFFYLKLFLYYLHL